MLRYASDKRTKDSKYNANTQTTEADRKESGKRKSNLQQIKTKSNKGLASHMSI